MNLLIVSLAFAPFSGVGAARMTSLSSYLSNENYNVNVLSYTPTVFGDTVEKMSRHIPENISLYQVEKKCERKNNENNIFLKIVSLIEKNNIELIIYSVGPYDIMPVIPKIDKIKRIPYVIDYRDIWLFETPDTKIKFINRIKRLVYDFSHLRLESKIMRKSKKVVFVSDGCKRIIQKRYHLRESICSCILNGFEKFEILNNSNRECSKYTITTAGKFGYYDNESALAFLDACCEINKSRDVILKHIGKQDFLSEKKFSQVYLCLGEKNYNETMNVLANSNSCLIVYRHKVGLGTKVFDYIALNKPIIYIGRKDTELSSFISSFENGYVCKTKEDIIKVIDNLVEDVNCKLTYKNVDDYSREYQNMKYKDLIEEVMN